MSLLALSILGASGISALGGLGSSMLGQYYNKKNMNRQAFLQYLYAKRYALNSPSWNVQGLRDAGLNPVLAVSNGVNLGANIPNITTSSPQSRIDIPAVEAVKAAIDADLGQQNANANSDMADAQSTNAGANMLRAKADAALKQAEAAKVIQDTKFDKEGGGFKNPVVNDLVRSANKGFDSVEAFQESLRQPRPNGDIPNYNPYTDASPKSSQNLDEYDKKMQKLVDDNERSQRLRRYERYEEENKNIPNLRRFIYQ